MNLESFLNQSQIERAFKELKRKKYKKDLTELKRYSKEEGKNLNNLGKYLEASNPLIYSKRELRNFSFEPFHGLKIKKSNKKFRPLLIPSSKDRIVLTAVYPLVKNKLARKLKANNALGLGLSNKSEGVESREVLNKIYSIIKSDEARFVLKLDFKDFFSSIDRSVLLRNIDKDFKGKQDRKLFRFIKKSIENEIQASPVFHGTFGKLRLRHVGIPQGLSYSPLLASFFALPLDKAHTTVKSTYSFRYLDDMIVLTKTREEAELVYKKIMTLSIKLKLTLHPLEKDSKTQIVDMKTGNFEFLGIGISKDSIYIPNEATASFKETFEKEILNLGILKEFTKEEVLKAYRQYADGWVNHYKTTCPKDFSRVAVDINNYMSKYLSKKRIYQKMFSLSDFELNYD